MSVNAQASTNRGRYQSVRQEERQRRILGEARLQIAALGYNAITMAGLAKAAEVSTKTLYNLYGSKDELLLAAVENLLQDIRQQPSIVGARQGVEALIAVCEASALLIVDSPNYAEAMARAFFQVDKNSRLSQLLAGDTRNQAQEAFLYSQQHAELVSNVDVCVLAEMFTAQQWGLVLSWSKGLIEASRFTQVALSSQLSTIVPVSKGRLKRWLQAKADTSGIVI